MEAETEIRKRQAENEGTQKKPLDEEQLRIQQAKRRVLLVRTFFALFWSLLTFLVDRNQLFEIKTIYQFSLSMFTLFLILDSPIVGYYIYSGLPDKIQPKDEELEEPSFVMQFVYGVKNLAGHISLLSLLWNLATDAAIYMFFLCALCGVY